MNWAASAPKVFSTRFIISPTSACTSMKNEAMVMAIKITGAKENRE